MSEHLNIWNKQMLALDPVGKLKTVLTFERLNLQMLEHLEKLKVSLHPESSIPSGSETSGKISARPLL